MHVILRLKYCKVKKTIIMKFFLAFAFLIASISAIPQPEYNPFKIDFSNERFVSGQIEDAIKAASQAIKDAGLDPLHIQRESSSYKLPVPTLFNYEAFIEDLLSTGLSDIKINRVSYSLITSRLNFDIELPLIHVSTGAARLNGVLFSNNIGFDGSGKVEVVRIRLVGVVRVSIGIISGISIRSITINFTLGDINSDVNLVIMGTDYSADFNDFVGSFVPTTIKAHYSEINELLELVLMELIEANM